MKCFNFLYFPSFPDQSAGISDVLINGPEVLENGRQQYVVLSCSFNFIQKEYKQLDIKWYFDNQVPTQTNSLWHFKHSKTWFCLNRRNLSFSGCQVQVENHKQ